MGYMLPACRVWEYGYGRGGLGKPASGHGMYKERETVGSVSLDEGYGVCTDAFLSSCESEFFGRSGLYGYVVGVDAHDIGKGRLHLGYAWVDLGTLSADGSVDVRDGVSFGGYELNGAA